MNAMSQKAQEYFKQGYNCCQSVVKAFVSRLDISEETAMKIASSFGGGLGYLREVCGAFSGIGIVLGLQYGYTEGFRDPADKERKAAHYALVKKLGEEFKKKAGGEITCRGLLHLDEHGEPLPGYEELEKPCGRLVGIAAEILDHYLESQR